MSEVRVRRSHAITKVVLGALAVLWSAVSAQSAPFSSDGITIDIPAGFEGPLSQSMGEGKTFAYTKQSKAPSVRTLLQITIFTPANGGIPKNLTQDELAKGSEKYLLDMLGGVARKRTEFSKGNVAHLSLGGVPASKVAWKGYLQGIEANGVMYCVVANGQMISFHTQDIGATATTNMREAMNAIEGIKIR